MADGLINLTGLIVFVQCLHLADTSINYVIKIILGLLTFAREDGSVE